MWTILTTNPPVTRTRYTSSVYSLLLFFATDMSEFVTPSTTVAANSDWTLVNFYVTNPDLILINSGDGSIDYLNDSPLGHVAAIKIIHNETASFDGVTETGTLKIDNFSFSLLLSLEENKKLKAKIYPNPFNDILFLEMDSISNGRLTITSIHGQELINTSFSSTNQLKIDASSIKSKGVYFLKIETASGALTKKIVKR
ncbi:T9SS type A sorting domain-containing protein [Kordia sp. YSTF-M3]|uniref:T9SS type A sorting domain-containing protein n=1 Tax=Kordia aestuariivivens TaxID=2759037 RepID=A0ABR7Q5S9_9FLAO|nr:T9SS type A sorting domain-containing protein [Kordia aestuariivivens]MBC8753877.1 T9SS type A sorting domain-containing protein [Kordia aestuariivivens]